ncbi:hypothetical protein cypCar_00049976 [Cyprinus carpio]|nr:hypothetical protein cypCar_00049976 [Cyprinus carpio]
MTLMTTALQRTRWTGRHPRLRGPAPSRPSHGPPARTLTPCARGSSRAATVSINLRAPVTLRLRCL